MKKFVFFAAFSFLLHAVPEVSIADPGDLDTGFGNGGIITTNLGGADILTDLVVLGDGKILVTGEHILNPGTTFDNRFLLVRYNPDGTLDSGFGSGGITTTDLGHQARSVALGLQSSGEIIVAGHIDLNDDGNFDAFVVAQYGSNGILDTTFGNNGFQTINVPVPTGGVASDLAIQGDDKMVLLGSADGDSNSIPDLFVLTRFNADGTPDAGFGTGGALTTSFDSRPAEGDALAIQDDGQIIAIGDVGDSGGADFALARYNASDGSLDASFGGTGKVFSIFGSGISLGSDLVIQGDGKIVAVGGRDTNNDNVVDVFAVARLNPNGSLDTSFGTDGKTTPDLGISADAKSVALQSNGKIIAGGGAAFTPTPSNPIADVFILARFNDDGSLDTTFGENGSARTEVGPKSQANAIAIQPDGKIVAGGFVDQDEDGAFDEDDDFALVRYLGGEVSGGGGGGGGGGCQMSATPTGFPWGISAWVASAAALGLRRCRRRKN